MLPKLANIRYTKAIDEVTVERTDRTVLITETPRMGLFDQPMGNIKAIDLTNSTDEIRQTVEQAYGEYVDYLNAHMKVAFSFEDWFSHTRGVDFTPKWRTFRPDQTELLS